MIPGEERKIQLVVLVLVLIGTAAFGGFAVGRDYGQRGVRTYLRSLKEFAGGDVILLSARDATDDTWTASCWRISGPWSAIREVPFGGPGLSCEGQK